MCSSAWQLTLKMTNHPRYVETASQSLSNKRAVRTTLQNAFLVRLLLSITDFRSFVQMMRETAQEAASEGKQG